METQNITLAELFSIVLFLGSVTYLIGAKKNPRYINW
jgi:hypothetical protein